MSGVFLCWALCSGCSDPTPGPGCEISTVVLDQCLTTAQCPDCTSVCEDREGTRVGGPQCAQFIGFGFFCACTCEFCFDGEGNPEE